MDATNAHELIMKERQLELAYEADRGFDVYRVGDTMKRHYPGFHDGVPEYPATSPNTTAGSFQNDLTLVSEETGSGDENGARCRWLRAYG